MVKKEKTSDPLLGEETPTSTESTAKPAKVETTKATPVSKTPKEQLKAEAEAKFPQDIVAQTKYILDGSEHTNFIVPMGENEAQGAYETVQINGYKLTIMKGVMVNIPVQIANLLAEKYRIAMVAGQNKMINRASDVSEALN